MCVCVCVCVRESVGFDTSIVRRLSTLNFNRKVYDQQLSGRSKKDLTKRRHAQDINHTASVQLRY